MKDSDDWNIVFFLDAQGSSPVEEYLDALDVRTRARFVWSLEQLRVRNVQATEPLVRKLQGKLWELRRAGDGNIYRVLYFVFTGRRIVLLHAFQKKTNKTPRREIEIAQQRMEDFLARAEKGE